MRNLTKNEQEIMGRILIIEEAVFGSDKAETIIALCKGTFEGTSNLQEELVILKMQLYKQELQLTKIKTKINEIITRLNK